ncbi:hypothetical protein EC991_002167 [Linnemannia zychae]|nr:hypothetical protein EC991_002167 [Linnemannia zychae]
MSADAITPSSTLVASSLPDILQALGAFLQTSELRSCVLVCRQWNDVFTPWLWRTIEDRNFSWPKITDQISPSPLSIQDAGNLNTGDKKDETWLREIFTKHGRNIRTLGIGSAILLSNISAAGTCTRLKSLTVQSIAPFCPLKEADALWELPALKDLKPYDLVTDDRQQEVFASHMLSPVFKDVVKPLPTVKQDVFPRLFMGSQRLCLMLMNNPDLETVELGAYVNVVANFFSEDFVIGLLASLPKLKRLNNHSIRYDLQALLERLPGLQHYCRRQNARNYPYNTLDHVGLNKPFPGLRTLSLLGRGQIRAVSVLDLLLFLPNLEQLTVASFLPEPRHSSDMDWLFRNLKHPRLQGFHITYPDHHSTRGLDETIASLLSCMPFLTTITLRSLMPEIAAALAEQCKYLESMTVLDSVYSPSPTSVGVRTNVAPDNFPVLLLQGCPKLKHFFATKHTIHVEKFLERPIVCHELETFCCRIVGVERLTPEEQAIYDSWVASAKATTEEEEEEEEEAEASKSEQKGATAAEKERELAEQILEKHHRILAQHHQVYDTFASRMPQLTILDFGFEYLVPELIDDDVTLLMALGDGAETYEIDGRVYLKGYGPIPDTLLLSLDSGVDRLGSLRELKEFGFEGVNHRIGKEELKWMVEAWPKLDHVTGVNDFVTIATLSIDCPKTKMLTEFLLSLRPDIRVTPN